MTLRVEQAVVTDMPAWLRLAAEVEPLFGVALSTDADFVNALNRNIARGTAFCVREGHGGPGAPLMGGLLYSPTLRPLYRLGWLAVAAAWRRHGVAGALAARVLSEITPPAEVVVKTFAEGLPGGEPARRFYASLGMLPAENLPGEGPYGSDIQVFRMVIR